MVSTAVLLESLDLIREQHFNNIWKGEILFSVDPGGVSGVSSHDLCQFFHNDCKLGITKLYVDSFKYPPPVAGLKQLPSSDPTWKKLAHDLQYASHESGSPLVLNGSNGVCRRMVCSFCYRMYKAPKNGKRSDSYRTESLINCDKQGRRDDG